MSIPAPGRGRPALQSSRPLLACACYRPVCDVSQSILRRSGHPESTVTGRVVPESATLTRPRVFSTGVGRPRRDHEVHRAFAEVGCREHLRRDTWPCPPRLTHLFDFAQSPSRPDQAYRLWCPREPLRRFACAGTQPLSPRIDSRAKPGNAAAQRGEGRLGARSRRAMDSTSPPSDPIPAQRVCGDPRLMTKRSRAGGRAASPSGRPAAHARQANSIRPASWWSGPLSAFFRGSAPTQPTR